jgi:hypothetical protein
MDADNQIVLQIKESNILINKGNIYKVEVSPDRIVILNQYGETALDLQNIDGEIILNADLYIGKDHIVANNNGTRINPPHDFV